LAWVPGGAQVSRQLGVGAVVEAELDQGFFGVTQRLALATFKPGISRAQGRATLPSSLPVRRFAVTGV
jgi:hypothetical protein